MAEYRLLAAFDRRLLWLSENKEQLSEAEREELLARVEFSEGRTLEKLRALAALYGFSVWSLRRQARPRRPVAAAGEAQRIEIALRQPAS